jgi:hypothetical protein
MLNAAIPRGRNAAVSRRMRTLALAATTLLVLSTAAAADPSTAKQGAGGATSFTDEQIAGGFFKIAFGAEFSTAGRVDRIRKYEGPVRVFAESRAKPDRRAQVATVVADIQSKIAHIDIAMARTQADATFAVSTASIAQGRSRNRWSRNASRDSARTTLTGLSAQMC